jgi:hypothetical protein
VENLALMRFCDAIDVRFGELGGVEAIGLPGGNCTLSRAGHEEGHEKQKQEQFAHGQ